MEKQSTNQNVIIRFPKLHEITSLSRTTIWRLEADGQFPKRLQVGNRGVGWLLNEVQDWMRSRPRSELKSRRGC
ncbi:MAG: AlpA family phage regulatory protein [Deltaproteobacteria bacterium]|nr:AlpA family phage regulatory protein [Deltaproteobacteria bacterium]